MLKYYIPILLGQFPKILNEFLNLPRANECLESYIFKGKNYPKNTKCWKLLYMSIYMLLSYMSSISNEVVTAQKLHSLNLNFPRTLNFLGTLNKETSSCQFENIRNLETGKLYSLQENAILVILIFVMIDSKNIRSKKYFIQYWVHGNPKCMLYYMKLMCDKQFCVDSEI